MAVFDLIVIVDPLKIMSGFKLGSEGDARLVGVNGLTRGMAGRVEVYTSGQWFTITKSSSVGREEADVICRQLGFPNSVYYGSVGDLGWV